ncbi:MAG: prolyl oligopeptidase family serine peptidase [Pirellulaceae bacterium]
MHKSDFRRWGMILTCLWILATSESAFGWQGQDKEAQEVENAWQDQFEANVFEDASGETLNYRLLVPESTADGERLPLVLFLHGAGERGDDNRAQLVHGAKDFVQRREKFPAIVVAPQCPREVWWGGARGVANQETTADKPDPLTLCHSLVEEIMKSHPVDPDRIYITGLSMGGFGTFEAIRRWPDLFAAAAPVCGGGDPSEETIKKIKAIPMWIAHGNDDRVVPFERSTEMVEALRKAGAEPHFVEMDGVGHNSWAATYADDSFHEWLFKQHKSPAGDSDN